jgi:hypothetical protein
MIGAGLKGDLDDLLLRQSEIIGPAPNVRLGWPALPQGGHVFQVVALKGQAMNGALRDTVHVPPMSMVSVALDAGEAARWMLHCHHMPHLATGMMTEFTVSA